MPGSGFKQIPGTWHFRMTILPQDAAFDAMLNKMHAFMEGLYTKWGQPAPEAKNAPTFAV